MQFSEIIGQNAIKEQLIQTVKKNRVSHAQLFLGAEGSGNLALAVAYAQYISCENRLENDSCGECSSCRKYNRLIHPDLHFSYPFFRGGENETSLPDLEKWREAFLSNSYLNLDDWREMLDAQNKQANINKWECLYILQRLTLKPFESEFKTMIIWLPEYLGKEGNRLLKTLEEPKEKTLILLVSNSTDQILTTILSRTQLVKIPAAADKDIYDFLISKKGLDEKRASQVVYLSNGNINSALNLINDIENDNLQLFSEWMRMIYGERVDAVINFIDVFVKLGRENQKNFFKYCESMTRESVLLLAQSGNLVHLRDAELTFITNFSKTINFTKAEAMMREFDKAHYHIERNANPKILFLDVSLQLVQILKYNTIPAGTQIYIN